MLDLWPFVREKPRKKINNNRVRKVQFLSHVSKPAQHMATSSDLYRQRIGDLITNDAAWRLTQSNPPNFLVHMGTSW